MKAIITQVENGWTLTIPPVDETDRRTVQVFEAGDDAGELPAMVRLLWAVIEHFGMAGSRYDERRLFVGLKPGDKYEKFEERR